MSPQIIVGELWGFRKLRLSPSDMNVVAAPVETGQESGRRRRRGTPKSRGREWDENLERTQRTGGRPRDGNDDGRSKQTSTLVERGETN